MNSTSLAIIQADELDTIRLTESDIVRFWKKVKMTGPDECWLWQGYLGTPGGYGRFTLNKVPVYTHRVAYTIANGSIPFGCVVAHHCDTPACCNPAHLFVGTQAENIADRDRKGHTPHLNQHNGNTAKLTEQDVRDIRNRHANGAKQTELVREYGISKSQMFRIVHGLRWTWME